MRPLRASFTSKCHGCGNNVLKDSEAIYDDDKRWIYHPACSPEQGSLLGEQESVELAERLGFRKHGELCPDWPLRELPSTAGSDPTGRS